MRWHDHGPARPIDSHPPPDGMDMCGCHGSLVVSRHHAWRPPALPGRLCRRPAHTCAPAGGQPPPPHACAAVLVVPVLSVRSAPHPYIYTHIIYFFFLLLFVFCIYKLDRCTRGPLTPDHHTRPCRSFSKNKAKKEKGKGRKNRSAVSVRERDACSAPALLEDGRGGSAG